MPVPDEKKGRKRMKDMSPSAIVGTITVIAVAGGIIGAKIFHILENLDDFARAPLAMIFSTGGLTFYGGLIVAALAIGWYLKKKNLSIPAVADAAAPGLILAYGIGRIGCHLAGDGDWGIPADPSARPEWIPTWLWSETYPNNILGIDLPATGVYPTSIYEFLMCVVLFAILWGVRKHPFLNGWLFSLYLVFAGVERFVIEQIRVNNEFDVFGLVVTQAEVISVLIILAGVYGLVRTSRRYDEAGKEGVPVKATPQPA